ncbi:hypothetical protein GCM10027053_11380 [Intrasporangium mesophilum]
MLADRPTSAPVGAIFVGSRRPLTAAVSRPHWAEFTIVIVGAVDLVGDGSGSCEVHPAMTTSSDADATLMRTARLADAARRGRGDSLEKLGAGDTAM